jgi:hypothetical protein
MKRRSFAAVTMTWGLLAGCGFVSVTPHGPPQPTSAPGLDPPPLAPTNGPGRTPGTDARRGTRLDTRVVCRASGVPNGFAVIDYVLSQSCGQPADSVTALNAVLIQDLRRLQPGSVVQVCREQKVPDGWVRTYNDEEPSALCQRPNAVRGLTITTMEIRKR